MFIEIHLLQSFAPSNLNRDDTGSPKDCEFGGVRRARISSQCLKRAMRTDPCFARATQVPLGLRTKLMVRELKMRLVAAGKPEESAVHLAARFVEAFISKLDTKTAEKVTDPRTAVLVYLSQGELQAITEGLCAKWDALIEDDSKVLEGLVKELTRAHKQVTSAPDIALFGRMLAEKPELGLEAACQVAHALSTHRVVMEMDFYTAVDDLLGRDEPGAGMMGVSGYNSACYYRYARIDWEQLVTNLKGDIELAARTVDGFLQAAINAVPSGKQNSHAALNPPSLALAVVHKEGMAWSLANAFEQPVRADREGGYVGPSLKAIDAFWGEVCAAYGEDSLLKVAAFRCGAAETETPHLATHLVAGEAAWRLAVLGALQSER